MTVIHSDCLDAMRAMPDASVDSIVSDPPYGLAFMGKAWDHGVPGEPFWAEALRVAKPGAYLVAFGGTRTYHRLACAIEDAGWEIRDCLSWLYGSGFPKSHDVSKAMDKEAGAERAGGRTLVTDGRRGATPNAPAAATCADCHRPRWGHDYCRCPRDGGPATDLARQWQGWGTALKPAWEPIILARKPLVGTVAANVAAHGTGALNVDGCRIGTSDNLNGGAYSANKRDDCEWGTMHKATGKDFAQPSGRWPANVCLDEDAAGMFPESRFFYTAKASRREREAGLEGMEEREYPVAVIQTQGVGLHGESLNGKQVARSRNHHPTVKPIALMRWLVRLVTPPNGLVLDPFTGSGTTGCAAVLEGFRFLGCEREAEYVAIAEKRIAHWAAQKAPEPEPSLF